MRPLPITTTAIVSAALAIAGAVVLLVASGGLWTGIGIVLLATAVLVVVLTALAGIVAASSRRGPGRRPGAPGPGR